MIFTTHDRHFMKRVATCVIEVKDGRVTNYNGDYDAYVYAVNQEIDDGEREAAQQRMSKAPVEVLTPKTVSRAKGRDERTVRKEISTIEKTIAKLDEQKKAANAQLMQSTDAQDALRLHNEVETLAAQLTAAEERWCALQEEIGEGW